MNLSHYNKRLNQLGYRVLRIQEYDIKTDLNNVILAIEANVLELEDKLKPGD